MRKKEKEEMKTKLSKHLKPNYNEYRTIKTDENLY